MKNVSYFCMIMAFLIATPAQAGLKGDAARELAEYVMKKFGKEVGEESVDTITSKIIRYTEHYGDDAAEAIRNTGPTAFKLIDDAGENGGAVVQLLKNHGNEAVWVASRPRNLAIFVKHGDEAGEAMIKHPGTAEPVIEAFGPPAARALKEVSGQNARRISMMADDGELVAAGKADELLGVIAKYGDAGADFIWKHKKSLAVAAVATAFLADPEPFINGVRDISEIAVEPIGEAGTKVAEEVAKSVDWTVVLSVGLGGITLLAALWYLRRRQRQLRHVSA